MRVLCCGSSLDGGGSERQLALLVQKLDRSKFQPELYLLYRRGVHLPSIPADVPIHAYSDAPPKAGLPIPGRLRRQQIAHLRSVIKQRQIELLYDRTYHVTLLTGAALASSTIPRVSTVVSPPKQDVERQEERYLWIKRWLLKRYYRQSARVVAVSQGVADQIIDYYGVDPARVQVIYSPIDIDRIDKMSRTADPDLALGDKGSRRFRLVSIGRLSEEKGHRHLVSAMAIVEKLHPGKFELHIAGDGPLRKELESIAREDGLTNSIVWHGYLDNPYALINSADLLVLPSLYEGLPNVVMEAMYLGVPVLSTDCPTGPRELLGSSEFGRLIPVADPQAMAAAIVDREANPSVWLCAAEKAKQRILQRHTLPVWLDQIERLFTQLVVPK